MLTLSFHGQSIDPDSGEDLYFPGQGRGRLEYRGEGAGEGYTVNVPFGPGQTDETFQFFFKPVLDKASRWGEREEGRDCCCTDKREHTLISTTRLYCI